MKLASRRWAIYAYLTSLREHGLGGLRIDPIPTETGALDTGSLSGGSVAVVDAGIDGAQALRLVQELVELAPSLPVVAVACCPNAVTPWHLQALVRAGASVLDLEAPPDEAVRALESVARGSSVLHLHLNREQRSFLHDVLVGRDAATDEKVQLLGLVARGLPDHEIGRRLHLSPHTVKHRIDDLRSEVGARNRIELAAWAGVQGFYQRDSPPVPVRLATTGAERQVGRNRAPIRPDPTERNAPDRA